MPAERRALIILAALTPLLAPSPAAAATAYSPCSSGTVMADGTPTRRGSLAHNGLPLGTRVWVQPAVFGRHRYTVRDRIGYGSEADFWTPSCSAAVAFGRRTVQITVGWRGWERRRARRVRAEVVEVLDAR
jgi:3D (Asp-Asp-Asp) domain-containing protein